MSFIMIMKAMKESGKEYFLIDGFPRNKDNLDGWSRQMGDKTNVKGVLFFECSEKVFQFCFGVYCMILNEVTLTFVS